MNQILITNVNDFRQWWLVDSGKFFAMWKKYAPIAFLLVLSQAIQVGSKGKSHILQSKAPSIIFYKLQYLGKAAESFIVT